MEVSANEGVRSEKFDCINFVSPSITCKLLCNSRVRKERSIHGTGYIYTILFNGIIKFTL